MRAYRVGVALLKQAEQQLAWVEVRHPELRPVRMPAAADGLLRLVLTYHAASAADAVEQTTELFEKAARITGDDVSLSRAGPMGIHVWRLGDEPPPEYEPE